MRYHHDSARGRDRPLRGEADDRGRLLTDGGDDRDEDDESQAAGGQEDEGQGDESHDDEDRDDERGDAGKHGEESRDDEGRETGDRGDESPDTESQTEPDGEPGGSRPGAAPDPERSNVEVTDEAEPADPKWERPDIDDIPEFEIRAEGPVTTDPGGGSGRADPGEGGRDSMDPGAGRPNTARSPDATRISSEGTEAFIVALEMCVRLPEEVRLPEDAAELVPTAVEAELEEDIQQFVAAEFGTQTPHVDVLTFEEVDDEIWLRLRIGLPAAGFRDLDPEAVRTYALEELEGVF